MWRSFFLAVGISLCILGAECLVVQRVVMAGNTAPANSTNMPNEADDSSPRHIQPPEWAPWSLMSAGAVVMLYSFTIPRRVAS